MTLPEGYTLSTHTTPGDSAWQHFENLALDIGIGFDEPTLSMHGALIRNESKEPVAALWTELSYRKPIKFGFHVAVSPDQQGKGLGRFLLDWMEHDLAQRRKTDPDLTMQACVINIPLRNALYRRGFVVTKDLRPTDNEEAYFMGDGATPEQMLTSQFLADPIPFDEALNCGAEQLDIPLYEWKERVLAWAKAPHHSTFDDESIEALRESIKALPGCTLEKQFLWQQTQRSDQLLACPLDEPPINKPKTHDALAPLSEFQPIPLVPREPMRAPRM